MPANQLDGPLLLAASGELDHLSGSRSGQPRSCRLRCMWSFDDYKNSIFDLMYYVVVSPMGAPVSAPLAPSIVSDKQDASMMCVRSTIGKSMNWRLHVVHESCSFDRA